MHVIDPMRHTKFGQSVYNLIMREQELDMTAEALAFGSARLHAASQIVDLQYDSLRDLVILERWDGAIVAYGSAVGVNPSLLATLEATLASALHVDIRIFLDVSADAAATRLSRQSETNRFETSGVHYLAKVRGGYKDWVNLRNVPIFDGTAESQLNADSILKLARKPD